MASRTLTIVILLTLLNQLCNGRDITVGKKSNELKARPSLTVEDLSYIISVRKGDRVATPRTLSPCARAILSCCDDKLINSRCSEAMKCGAFFFDDNPCDDKFVIDALKAARTFYEQYNEKN